MKNTSEIAFMALCLLLFVFGASGCGVGRGDLAQSLDRNHEKCHSEKVHIAWHSTYEYDDGFVIAGVLRRDDTVGGPITVNVHAAIVSPEGDVIGEAQSDEVRVPHRALTKVQGFQRFKIRFPSMPPEDASVQLSVCAG